MLVRQYNHYIKINGLKHNDKNLINFGKTSLKGKQSENKEKVVN